MKSGLISPFDPWSDPLCTCGPKFSLNPYTGCGHGCLYCYVSSYIPDFFRVRPKRDLLQRLKRGLRGFRGVLTMANSSDPYPPLERELCLTRRCLELIQGKRDVRLLLVTKSDLVKRDSDLLAGFDGRVVVAITITTLDEGLARRLEPGAPPPKAKLRAVEELSCLGIPVMVRVDPLIPYLNIQGLRELVSQIKQAGARHITASTYKAKPDNWKRLKEKFPEQTGKLYKLYFQEGEKKGNTRYLPRGVRRKLLETVRHACEEEDIRFAVCREGLEGFSNACCDGRHLLKTGVGGRWAGERGVVVQKEAVGQSPAHR